MPVSECVVANRFFHPRLVHFRSEYEQTPGIILSDWRNPKLSWLQKARRRLLYKIPQERPSPPGMSRLPVELLEMIFWELCGREVHAVRLVCTDWEKASRPFFAELHLKRSLFWMTGADLRRLERLASKFGPYMGTVHVATDHFTTSGLRQVWGRYTRHRDHLARLAELSKNNGDKAVAIPKPDNPIQETDAVWVPQLGYIYSPLRDEGKVGSEYFRHCYQQHQPLSPWRHLRLYAFLWQYLCNMISQTLLHVTGEDERRLAEIAGMMPNGRLEAVRVSYKCERLNGNRQRYGRGAPAFAFELALLCGNGVALFDREYEEHVRRIVGDVMDGRK